MAVVAWRLCMVLVVVHLCAAQPVMFHAPPPPDHHYYDAYDEYGHHPALSLAFGPAGHLPVPPPPHPQAPNSAAGCPEGFQCADDRQCIAQCLPGWQSGGSPFCFLIVPTDGGPSGGRETWNTASRLCPLARQTATLPLLEQASDLASLLSLLAAADRTVTGVAGANLWTSARWNLAANAWLWVPTGRRVDFARLGVPSVARPQPDEQASSCLMLNASSKSLVARNCSTTLPVVHLRVCQLATVSRCDRAASRRCCAVTVHSFPERPACYVDDAGTRCEQRVREGYFPLDGDNLVRVSRQPSDWTTAREVCRRDGGDLAVVTSQQFHDRLVDILKYHLLFFNPTLRNFYIGLRSDASGVYTHVNGIRVEDGFRNFASVTDASRPDACAYYNGNPAFPWSTEGACATARHYVCHIGPLRRHLSSPPAVPLCGRRNSRGVLGRASTGESGQDQEAKDSRASNVPHSLFSQPVIHRPFLPPPHHNRPRPHQPAFSDTKTQFGEISWQAAVWVKSGASDVHQFACAAALVSNFWVLTSAGCVDDVSASNVTVTLGEWKLNSNTGESSQQLLPVIPRQVTQIRTSEDEPLRLTPYGARPVAGGVALLRLSSTPPLPSEQQRPHISRACLPDPQVVSDNLHRLHCVVTGWRSKVVPKHEPHAFPHASPHQPPTRYDNSLHEQDDPDNVLRKLEVRIDDDARCQHEAFLRDEARAEQQRQREPGFGAPYYADLDRFTYNYAPSTPFHGIRYPGIIPRSIPLEDEQDHEGDTKESSDESDKDEEQQDDALKSSESRTSADDEKEDLPRSFPGPYRVPPPPPPPPGFYGNHAYGGAIPRPPPPGRRLCAQDHRCIPDDGAVLACTLPPPPPAYGQYFPQAYPRPYRSQAERASSGGQENSDAKSDSERSDIDNQAADAEKKGKPSDNLSQEAVRKGSYVLKQLFQFAPSTKHDISSLDKHQQQTKSTTTESAKKPASPKQAKNEKETSPDTGAAESRTKRSATDEAEKSPAAKIGGVFAPQFHLPVPPHHQPPVGHLPISIVDEPVSASTEDYEAYFVVGVASPGTGQCGTRPMIFDDVLSQLDFIYDTING